MCEIQFYKKFGFAIPITSNDDLEYYTIAEKINREYSKFKAEIQESDGHRFKQIFVYFSPQNRKDKVDEKDLLEIGKKYFSSLCGDISSFIGPYRSFDGKYFLQDDWSKVILHL